MKKYLGLSIMLLCFLSSGVFAHGMKKHAKVEIKNMNAIPIIQLEVIKDAVKGWNVHMKTENFRFAPENVNTTPREGEGHAHLYINEKKIRVYSPYFHIMMLPKGKNKIRATLNANDHSEYAVKGKVVEDTVYVESK